MWTWERKRGLQRLRRAPSQLFVKYFTLLWSYFIAHPCSYIFSSYMWDRHHVWIMSGAAQDGTTPWFSLRWDFDEITELHSFQHSLQYLPFSQNISALTEIFLKLLTSNVKKSFKSSGCKKQIYVSASPMQTKFISRIVFGTSTVKY